MSEQHAEVYQIKDESHPHHAHRHPPAQPDETPPGHYELMILAMRDLLIEKGILTADQIRRGLETLDSWQPSRGAEIVARAWTDPAFKRRLLADGNEAVADFGIDMGGTKLTVLENTDTVQNVVVCTLCSCYPRAVLGLPPDWYRSRNYRARVVREPRKVLSEFGTSGDLEPAGLRHAHRLRHRRRTLARRQAKARLPQPILQQCRRNHHFPDLSLLARPAANLGLRKTAATPALTPVGHSHPNSSQGAAPQKNPSNVKMRIAGSIQLWITGDNQERANIQGHIDRRRRSKQGCDC